jgi:hypothetical protein
MLQLLQVIQQTENLEEMKHLQGVGTEGDIHQTAHQHTHECDAYRADF